MRPGRFDSPESGPRRISEPIVCLLLFGFSLSGRPKDLVSQLTVVTALTAKLHQEREEQLQTFHRLDAHVGGEIAAMRQRLESAASCRAPAPRAEQA